MHSFYVMKLHYVYTSKWLIWFHQPVPRIFFLSRREEEHRWMWIISNLIFSKISYKLQFSDFFFAFFRVILKFWFYSGNVCFRYYKESYFEEEKKNLDTVRYAMHICTCTMLYFFLFLWYSLMGSFRFENLRTHLYRDKRIWY